MEYYLIISVTDLSTCALTAPFLLNTRHINFTLRAKYCEHFARGFGDRYPHSFHPESRSLSNDLNGWVQLTAALLLSDWQINNRLLCIINFFSPSAPAARPAETRCYTTLELSLDISVSPTEVQGPKVALRPIHLATFGPTHNKQPCASQPQPHYPPPWSYSAFSKQSPPSL